MARRSLFILRFFVYYIAAYLFVCASVFVSAGTFDYPEGRFTLLVTISVSFGVAIYFMIKDPKLVEQSLRFKRGVPWRKMEQTYNIVAIYVIFVVSGLSYRFGLKLLPFLCLVIGTIGFLCSYYLIYKALTKSHYLFIISRVNEQKEVIGKGFYAYIRHPIRAIMISVTLPIPLMMRSYLGLATAILIITGIYFRTLTEEKFLLENIQGYNEYQKKVDRRFVPKIFS